jgi:hypothetical protein
VLSWSRRQHLREVRKWRERVRVQGVRINRAKND